MAGVMQSDHRLHDGLVRERPCIGPEAAHLAQRLKRRAYFRHCRRVGQHRIDIPGFLRLARRANRSEPARSVRQTSFRRHGCSDQHLELSHVALLN